jgi:pimeloyl-ACP methyl ester carboxylesterase
MRGQDDVYLSSEISSKLHREIPCSHLVEVPEAGHFIQVDQPERIVRELRAFLGT